MMMMNITTESTVTGEKENEQEWAEKKAQEHHKHPRTPEMSAIIYHRNENEKDTEKKKERACSALKIKQTITGTAANGWDESTETDSVLGAR